MQTAAGLFQGLGLVLFNAPRQPAGIQGADADLIGLEGADLADPGDAKARFAVPAAFYFDDVAGGGQVSDAVEASSVFTDVYRVGCLCKGVAVAVFTADDDLEGLRRTRAAACLAPKCPDGRFESDANVVTALVMRFLKDHAYLLFFARKFIDNEKFFAERNRRKQADQSATAVEHQGGGVFVEGADGAAPAVDEDGNMERLADFGAQFLFRSGWPGRSRFLRNEFGAIFGTFERKFGLNAVSWTFKSERSGKNLFEGIELAGERDPVLVIAVGAANVKVVGPRGA